MNTSTALLRIPAGMAVNAGISFSSAPNMRGGTLWQLMLNLNNTPMMRVCTLQIT